MRVKAFILTADALFALSIAMAAAALVMALTQAQAMPKASYYASSIGYDALTLNLNPTQFSSLGLQGSIANTPQGGRMEVRAIKYTYPSCYTAECMAGQDLVTPSGDFKQNARNQQWVKTG